MVNPIPAKLTAADYPKVDVPTGVKAELQLPAGAGSAANLNWTKNGTPWAPPANQVDPIIGEDVTYEVVVSNVTCGAVIRWQPDAPAKVALTASPGSASVSWPVIDNEDSITYYEVAVLPVTGPALATLPPRRVLAGAPSRTGNRTVAFDSVPPGFYTATASAVRLGRSGGAVTSATTATGGAPVEVIPTGGPYERGVRYSILGVGLLALAWAVFWLSRNPKSGSPDRVDLNGWALWIALLVTLFLLAALTQFVSIKGLLTGADNRISTSRVNVALWTVVIAFGICTLAAFAFGAHEFHRVNPCGLNVPSGKPAPHGATVDGICVSGNSVDYHKLGLDTTFKNGLAPNYLVLLGTPFVALAGASFVVNRQVSSGTGQKVESAGPPEYKDALTNDDGTADLVDSQYLIFTGVLLFYFLTNFLPSPSELPDLPWSLVGLTGVSAGTYLLNKNVSANGLSVNGFDVASTKPGDTVRVLGLNFLPAGSSTMPNGGVSVNLAGRTLAPTAVTNTAVTFLVPADLRPGTYPTVVTTAANVSGSAGALQVV
jgi:hypothetical protein